MSQLAEGIDLEQEQAVARGRPAGGTGLGRALDCPTDRRGQVAELTDEGFAALAAAAPGHVEQVRRSLIDALSPEQVAQLRQISEAIMASAGACAAVLGEPPVSLCQSDDGDE